MELKRGTGSLAAAETALLQSFFCIVAIQYPLPKQRVVAACQRGRQTPRGEQLG